MQISNPDISNMRPCGFTTENSLPAIQWWRAGDVSKGEKHIVVALTAYATEAERTIAYQATKSSATVAVQPALAPQTVGALVR
jgi:hypothetical protein